MSARRAWNALNTAGIGTLACRQSFGRAMLRIRLKFDVIVQGEHANVWALGYYVMASGRMRGPGGINDPEPVKPQG